MLGQAWLTLKQATDALKNGRLEEAQRFLCQPDAQGHKGSWELLQDLARGYVERGERNLEHDEVQSAWNDLLQAEQIGGSDTARLRQALVKRGLLDAKSLLETGEPGRVADLLAQLRERGVQQTEVQQLEEAAKGWVRARDLATRGEFSQALQETDRARLLLPAVPATLERFHEFVVGAGKSFAVFIVELLEAVERENWRDALQVSEKILALAPQHAEARKARARAWKSIEPSTTPSPRPIPLPPQPRREPPSQRYLLWVDGVGGYLVCLGTRITLGQATPDAYVDVPLFADVSRVHAALTRDAEGYLLEAIRPVQVNGQPAERTLLRPGDRVTLGACCQLQFQQPVPVSATARLDITSGHRLPLTIDKVFLMADTLLLGPGPQAHVVIPDVRLPIVLYRNKDGLAVKYAGKLTVDGQSGHQRSSLTSTSKVTGEEFSFALEPVGANFGRV